MRGSFTFEERVALWVLGALLACVAVAFVFAANQAGAAEAPPVPKAMPTPAPNYRDLVLCGDGQGQGRSGERLQR